MIMRAQSIQEDHLAAIAGHRRGAVMTNPDLGQKRRCLECDAAFYDLKRDPITCPKCGAVHQPVARLKSDGRTPPKGRVFTKPKKQPEPALEPAGAAEAGD